MFVNVCPPSPQGRAQVWSFPGSPVWPSTGPGTQRPQGVPVGSEGTGGQQRGRRREAGGGLPEAVAGRAMTVSSPVHRLLRIQVQVRVSIPTTLPMLVCTCSDHVKTELWGEREEAVPQSCGLSLPSLPSGAQILQCLVLVRSQAASVKLKENHLQRQSRNGSNGTSGRSNGWGCVGWKGIYPLRF